MTNENKEYYFLQGGGEMGKLIRAKDWTKTPLGDPKNWPQSLRTMVAVLLDNPFGMYIAWGKEYTQIYNDGYRPILGTSKHPQALGISTRETFAEIWHIIGCMFEGVMKGKPIGFPDFMLPLDRNGFVEKCYFDFAYSPIRLENGEVGGVLVTVIETTKKKKAEDELKESEHRFKSMADNIPNLAWMAKADGWIYWYNKKWYDYTGTTLESMEGWGWQAVHDPHELPWVLEQWKTSIAEGNPFEMIFPLKGADGEFRQFLTRALPVRNTTGDIIHWFGTNTDITVQKETEKALLESKSELEFVIEAAQLGTFDYNPKTNKFSGNLRLKGWFGLPAEDHIELTDAVNVIAEMDKEKVSKAIQNALVYASGGTYDVEYTIVHPVSKKEIIVHAKGKAWFDEEKIAYRLNGTLEDVTERTLSRRKTAQNEQNIRNMILQAPIGICVLDATTLISEIVNDRFVEIAGKPYEDIVGKYYWNTFAEAKEFYEPALNKVVETGQPFYATEVELMLIRHDKEEIIYVTFVYAPLKDEAGKVVKVAVWVLDNTTQVVARKKITVSETNLKLMILQAPIAIAILRGTDYKVEIANKFALEIWGRTEEEVLNMPLFQAMPELLTQGIRELLDNVWHTGIRFATPELPMQFMRMEVLETVYINFSFEALYNADGQIDGVMAIGFEVTTQVLARQKLESNEVKLNIVIDASELGIWEYDIKTEERIISPRCYEIFGVSDQSINPKELSNNYHPDDEPIRQKAFEKVLETGILNYESRILWEDKSIHWIETKGKVFYNKDNQPERLLGTVRDITEEKNFHQQLLEREQKFRLLADSMPQHIWTADPEGNLNYFNQSVFDYSGLTLEQIDKAGWLQIVHPDDREANIKAWVDSITTGKDFLFEHRFRKYNGEYRWQLSRAIPQKDKNGKIKMWVGTSTDIQNQKMFTSELEKKVLKRTSELNQKNIALEKMNKELQSFTYISSHDLQEPLRKIQTFASRILENENTTLSDKAKGYLTRMQVSAHRMQTLIQDLLTYSRTNSPEKKFEIVDLNKIIEDIKDELKDELEKKNATVETGKMCKINIIPFQFRQLIVNLISNSLKFSQNHPPPHIIITSEIAKGTTFKNEKLVPEKRYCHISFSDNGIGFEQQYSEKIFDVFQRLHGKEKYQGTGIGLSIVKKIVENHDGIIEAKGEPNKGAKFDIYIPET